MWRTILLVCGFSSSFLFFFSFLLLCDLDLSMTRRTDTLPHATQIILSNTQHTRTHIRTPLTLTHTNRNRNTTQALTSLINMHTRTLHIVCYITYEHLPRIFFLFCFYLSLVISLPLSYMQLSQVLFLSQFFFSVHSWSATSFFFLSIIWVNLSQRKKNSPCSGELIRFFFWYLVCFV